MALVEVTALSVPSGSVKKFAGPLAYHNSMIYSLLTGATACYARGIVPFAAAAKLK